MSATTSTPRSRALAWSAALFLISLALRGAHLFTIRDTPFARYLFLDPQAYDDWGLAIAGGRWIGERIFFQDPLYAYFLGAVYALFGHHHLAVLAIQVVLGSLVAPLVFQAARRWLGTPAAAVSGMLAAVYLPAVYYDGQILKTSLATFLTAAALAALSRAPRSPSSRAWLVPGVLFGLLALARGNVLLCVPALAIWVVLDRSAVEPVSGPPSPASRGRAAALAASWLLVGAALPVATTAVRNLIVGGQWVLTTVNAGQNFYIGNNPFNTRGRYDLLPFVDPNPKHEERDFAREAERRTARTMTPAGISRFWWAEAWRWIRSHPRDWLRLTWRKLRNFWGAYEIPDNLDYYLVRERAPVLRLPLPGFGLVAPLGLLGAGLAVRRGGWPRAVVLFVAVYSASVIAFFVFSRFRLVMMPALFVLAGTAVTECATLAARRRVVRLGAACLTFVALAAFVNLPVQGPRDDPRLRIASACGLPVRVETTATGHYNLGLVYAARAKGAPHEEELLRQAEQEFRLALEQDDRHAKIHFELGKVLARLGRNRDAVASFRQAARLEPYQWRYPFGLGLLFEREGDLGAAEDAFREAMRLAPLRSDVPTRLGEVLLARGRPAEAAEAFRHALRLEPTNTRARTGLHQAGSGLESQHSRE